MTTPTTMLLTEAAPILNALDEIRAQLAALQRGVYNTEPADTPAYLYPAALGRRFGMKPRTTLYHLAAAREAGAVRTLTPPTPTGTPGRTLYHVADFEAFLRESGRLAAERHPA